MKMVRVVACERAVSYVHFMQSINHANIIRASEIEIFDAFYLVVRRYGARRRVFRFLFFEERRILHLVVRRY